VYIFVLLVTNATADFFVYDDERRRRNKRKKEREPYTT
jgi:hypothetical protein